MKPIDQMTDAELTAEVERLDDLSDRRYLKPIEEARRLDCFIEGARRRSAKLEEAHPAGEDAGAAFHGLFRGVSRRVSRR